MQYTMTSAASSPLRQTVEAALRRFDRLRLDRVTLFVLQDAPRSADRDREALAQGTATRRAVLRLWRIPDEHCLGRALFVNAYPAPPMGLAGAAAVAAARLDIVLRTGGQRIERVVACGAWQRNPVSAVLGLRRGPDWNEVHKLGAVEVATVYHPSPRNRAWNPGEPGRGAVPMIQRWFHL
jgi:hypothetical protein